MPEGEQYDWGFLTDCHLDIDEYTNCRSPLKYYVLDLVDRRGKLTYIELADITGMPQTYAADRLPRYARKGLLKRDREGSAGLSTYSLTPHGSQRLRYFRGESLHT